MPRSRGLRVKTLRRKHNNTKIGQTYSILIDTDIVVVKDN